MAGCPGYYMSWKRSHHSTISEYIPVLCPLLVPPKKIEKLIFSLFMEMDVVFDFLFKFHDHRLSLFLDIGCYIQRN